LGVVVIFGRESNQWAASCGTSPSWLGWPLRVETVADAVDNAGSAELIRGWNARPEKRREAFAYEHAAHLDNRGLVLP
jgi:hypothetical protein